MKIQKFINFINETHETPEEYIKIALMKLKKKIESFFEADKVEDSGSVMTMDQAIEKGKKKESDKMSFKDLGVSLESSEFSKYSSMNDSINIKFSDPEFFYNLFISVPLEEGVPQDKEADFSDKDVKKCFVKFKKYDSDKFDLIGQISKNAELAEIDEDYIISLKIELDEEFGDTSDDLTIETEE